MDNDIPPPDPLALAHSRRLGRLIRSRIEDAGGALPFDRFMELALYAPGLGYYVAGSRKLGAAGDFVTAPETSPLFARCLARQCAQVLTALGGGGVLELGAGSGALAADLLAELEVLGARPAEYLILEVSPELRERQGDTVAQRYPGSSSQVRWLDRLPEGFVGVVIANEVLDAMPVNLFRVTAGGAEEGLVRCSGEGFAPVWRAPARRGVQRAINHLRARGVALAPGYVSEINLRLGPWVRGLAGAMDRGAVLLVDYGYPRGEYYHPQRSMGTLMCHYRQRAHPDPYRLVGLQDITAHVDFSAAADAARAAGLRVTGYTTQAHFLLGCGLAELVAAVDPGDTVRHLELVQAVKRLTLPEQMGESFKVLGLTRDLQLELVGFRLRDLSDRL